MKTALALIIMVSVSVNCLGQNFCTNADESSDCVLSIFTDAEASFGIKLQKKFRVENSSKTANFFQNDCERFQNNNFKFKVTFSDSWFSRDKAHHFLTSAFLSAAGYYLLREEQKFSNQRAQTGGFCFSLSLGLAKEFRDGLGKNNAFSAKDLAANLLGIAAGLVIISD